MKKNLLFILVICIIIFMLNYNKKCSVEKFSDVCWSLQSSYEKDILNQNKKLIASFGLNNYINKIIEPLVKSELIDKNLTLEKYFSNIKIPLNNIDQATILIKNIVNNNCLISSLFEYDIKKTNLLIDVVSIWNMHNLINNMLCVIEDKKVIEDLIKQLFLVIISPKIEFCSKDNFQKYCEKSYQNYLNDKNNKVKVKVKSKSESPKSKSKFSKSKSIIKSASKLISSKIKSVKAENKKELENKKVKVENKKELEKFTQKLDKTIQKIDNSSIKLFNTEIPNSSLLFEQPKYMDIYSLSEYLKNFNSKSFGSVLEKNMMVLMLKFKKNNNKEFNILEKKDFGKLIRILVSDIKTVVNNIVNEDDIKKLKPYVFDFRNLQKIFYLLKHNFRLLLTYQLINKMKKDDEKLQAQLCCSKTSEKSCFNFSVNPKKSSALFYGFDDLGYVKNVKCVKNNEVNKILEKEQNMTIDELFNSKYAAWRNITKENKNRIYANIINYLKIFGINLNKIDDKIINIRLQLEKQKYKLNMRDFEINKIPLKLGNIHLKFKVNNNNYNNTIDRIKKSDNLDKLNEILKSLGYSKENIIFNNSVDLSYAKNITETLVLINEVFKNFESNNPIIVGKLFGLIKTQDNFSQIMRNTTILHRYHQTIVDFIINKIKKFAVIRKYTMNSLPETTIKYLQSKPSSSNLDFCNVHEEFLSQLRKDRSITNNEYNEYLQRSYLYCDPNKVNIKNMKSITFPKSNKKGLSIVERKYKSYKHFIKEKENLLKDNLDSKVISDNILFNTLKNMYN
jgi:hypothetical protein